jgi:hypothetical protein
MMIIKNTMKGGISPCERSVKGPSCEDLSKINYFDINRKLSTTANSNKGMIEHENIFK